MACSYIIAGSLPELALPEEPFNEAMPDLPALPALDPLPAWDVPDVVVAPEIAPADPATPAPEVIADPVAWIEGDAPGLVEQVMATTGSLAAASQANALASIEALAGYAAAFTPVDAPAIPTAAVDLPGIGDAPAAPDLTSDFGTLPGAPGDPGAPALDVPAAPEYDVATQTISDIELPDPLTALEPTEPDLLAVTAPAEPDFTLPAAPSLVELSIPDAPVLTLPTFDSSLGGRPDAPQADFAYHEVDYQSQLLTAMHARLATLVLTDTETGVTAEVEAALAERAAEREALLTHRATGEAMRLMKARGFRMPEATMIRVVQQAMQGGLQRSASLARDIRLTKAQLWQQNFRFAIESGIALEARMIDKHNAAQARALEAAKVMVTTEIAFFNANVQLFQADVQAFAIKAQVFKTRLEAALARIEVYRAQLEAEKAKGEINSQKVLIYKAQVAGVAAIVDTYKARVDAAKQMIEAGKGRVDAYKARVQAFAAQIDAKDAEYEGYAARMKAQSMKAQLFGRQVEAYRSRVGAFDALVKAKVGVQELRFKQANEFPLALYRAKIDAYRIGTQAAAEKMKSTVQVFASRIRAFVAQEGAKNEHVDAQIAVARANAEGAIAEAQALIQAGEANLRIADGAAQTAQNNVRSAGQLSGQLAAAAIAAQSVHAAVTENGSFSISNHAGDSASNATNVNALTSTSESVSNNTSTTANSGVSRNTSVTNSHGRSYNRGYSNTTTTQKAVHNSTSTSVHNTYSDEVRLNDNLTVSNECVDRTIHTDN